MQVSGTLVNMDTDPLNPAILEAALVDELVGHTVEYHGTVASTMPLARALAIDPSTRPGTIVIAEEQTAGRGRLSRGWEAPYGEALLVSIVLKPPLLPLEPTQLPMIAGISLIEAIGRLVSPTEALLALKWPNDVLLKRPPPADDVGKVAGILIESAYAGPTLDYALLGMGINVNQSAVTLQTVTGTNVQATSIRQQIGRPIDRTALCIALCSSLASLLAQSRTAEGSDKIHRQWRTLLTTIGQNVTVRGFGIDQVLNGRAIDVDRIGNLIVEDADGRRHACSAGDVTLRPRQERPANIS